MLEWRDLPHLRRTLGIGLQRPPSVDNYNPIDQGVYFKAGAGLQVQYIILKWLDSMIGITFVPTP